MPAFQEEQPDTQKQFEDMGNKVGEDFSAAMEGVSTGNLKAAMPLIVNYVIPAVGVLLLLIVAFMVAKFAAGIASAPIRKRVDETLGRFVGKVVYYAIMISVVIAILGKFGFQVASFAALLASIGFAIGMAFQGTLGNFASGIMLLVFRPFKVGDVINAAGVTAKVNEIDLFTTVLDTPDNRRIIVPNTSITSGIIENVTHHVERRVDVSVGCDYSADIGHTRSVLEAAAESLQDRMIVGEGRGYQVVLDTLGDSAVGWTVRFWTHADNFWNVKEVLTETIKNRLDEAGIDIPFPQLDIRMTSADSSDA